MLPLHKLVNVSWDILGGEGDPAQWLACFCFVLFTQCNVEAHFWCSLNVSGHPQAHVIEPLVPRLSCYSGKLQNL